jgi:hypothetical protein
MFRPTNPDANLQYCTVHCKKMLAVFPSPTGMSYAKLSLAGNNKNYSRPVRVWGCNTMNIFILRVK